ncbi:MAG: fatty acid desaturase [Sandaracinaceae bacterium]|nr:fatty acid desaturase [Sandaracinaceae bacterium]
MDAEAAAVEDADGGERDELVDDVGRAALAGAAKEPKPRRVRARYGGQNLVVTVAQTLGWAGLLTLVDQVDRWWLAAPLVLLFCFVMQGVFTMMHEFFHGLAHPDPRVNYAIGLWGSLLFGTSATLHRINHWGHHVRNRTPAEQGEFYMPGESRLRKTALYYFATLGGLYLGGLVFPLASFFVPYSAIEWLAQLKTRNTYSAAFEQFKAADWTRMRVEGFLLMAFWIPLAWLGPWKLSTLAICYGAFMVTWSSLQWAYHLRTPLHVVEGAYNLRLPTPIRWLFLNFNCNLTHHRRPHLPWQDLHANTDPRETQPLWYRWLLVLLPPEPFPADPSKFDKRYF